LTLPGGVICQKQLPVLNALATELASGSHRFICLSRKLPPELQRAGQRMGWQAARAVPGVGLPNPVRAGSEGKILQVIPGVPEHLKMFVLTSLTRP